MAGFATEPGVEVRAGRLHEELLCVLDTQRLEVPPLRQRLGELPLLVARMSSRLNEDGEKTVAGLAEEVWDHLRGYAWPGNLTELLLVLTEARGRASGERIQVRDLPLWLRLQQGRDAERPRADKAVPLTQVLEQVERRLIPC